MQDIRLKKTSHWRHYLVYLNRNPVGVVGPDSYGSWEAWRPDEGWWDAGYPRRRDAVQALVDRHNNTKHEGDN